MMYIQWKQAERFVRCLMLAQSIRTNSVGRVPDTWTILSKVEIYKFDEELCGIQCCVLGILLWLPFGGLFSRDLKMVRLMQGNNDSPKQLSSAARQAVMIKVTYLYIRYKITLYKLAMLGWPVTSNGSWRRFASGARSFSQVWSASLHSVTYSCVTPRVGIVVIGWWSDKTPSMYWQSFANSMNMTLIARYCSISPTSFRSFIISIGVLLSRLLIWIGRPVLRPMTNNLGWYVVSKEPAHYKVIGWLKV